jgi:hypothetical protein
LNNLMVFLNNFLNMSLSKIPFAIFCEKTHGIFENDKIKQYFLVNVIKPHQMR